MVDRGWRRIAADRCGYASARSQLGARSRPLQRRLWALDKAAAAALRVRTRKLNGPSRARCDSDRGRWAKQPQRQCGSAPGSWTGRIAPAATTIAALVKAAAHCGFAPGSWTCRNGDGDEQGRHGTFNASPRERKSCAEQLGCLGPWHQTLAAHSLQSIRQSQLGAGIEAADWLGLAGRAQLAWLDRSGRFQLSRKRYGAQLPAGPQPPELLAAPKQKSRWTDTEMEG